MDERLKAALREVGEGLLEAVKETTGQFIADHADAKVFLKDRLRRLGSLGLKLGIARARKQPTEKIEADIGRVKNTIELELNSIALDAEKAARQLFRERALFALEAILRIAARMAARL